VNTLLSQILDEISADAAALSKRLAQTAGRVPQLVEAQITVAADQLRNDLRRLAERLDGVPPKGATP